METDFELLDAWRDGDRGGGSELFARHFAYVFGFFRSKLEHVAEDLTQQTFLRIVEAREDFRGNATFRTYLFVVARNVLYDHLRRIGNRPTEPDFDNSSLVDLEPSVSRVLIELEEHKLLVHALRSLPLALQIALELYYVQRLRGHELAQVLDVPHGTVRSRIRRAIEMLRARIAELADSPQAIRTTLTDLERWAVGLRGAAG